MSDFVPMIICYDQPVLWRQFVAECGEEPAGIAAICRQAKVDPPDPDVILELIMDRQEAILTATALALEIPLADIYRAATGGRVRWMSPFVPGAAPPVLASLDGREWIEVHGVRNGAPDVMPVPQMAAI